MPESAKRKRKRKIQDVYKSGKHDHIFERYSEERQGLNNPNAKITMWMGKQYTMKQFMELKIPKEE